MLACFTVAREVLSIMQHYFIGGAVVGTGGYAVSPASFQLPYRDT
jgi:hypothetical protein